MIPINGFFEYGIMALLGAVGVLGLTIWTLALDQTARPIETVENLEGGHSALEAFQYKKAA